MEITTVNYTRRKNLGNYEHEELSFSANVEVGENPAKVVQMLKELAQNELFTATTENLAPSKSKLEKALENLETKEENSTEPRSEVPGDVPPPIPQESKEEKPKRTRKTKAAATDEMEEVESPYKATPSETTSEESEDVPTAPAKLPKGTVTYDKDVKEHRSRLATYLGTHHAGWQTKKPKEQIAAFSAGLQGKPFEDAKGNMLESFSSEIAAFFG